MKRPRKKHRGLLLFMLNVRQCDRCVLPISMELILKCTSFSLKRTQLEIAHMEKKRSKLCNQLRITPATLDKVLCVHSECVVNINVMALAVVENGT